MNVKSFVFLPHKILWLTEDHFSITVDYETQSYFLSNKIKCKLLLAHQATEMTLPSIC